MIELMLCDRPRRARGVAAFLLLLCCSCAGSSAREPRPDFGQGSDTWSSTDFSGSTDRGSGAGSDAARADLAAAADAQPACADGKERCGSACVDLTADQLNCGKCGQACAAELKCIEGNCLCPDGQQPPCGPCKTIGQACSGDQCCEGLICGYYGSSLACKRPDA